IDGHRAVDVLVERVGVVAGDIVTAARNRQGSSYARWSVQRHVLPDIDLGGAAEIRWHRVRARTSEGVKRAIPTRTADGSYGKAGCCRDRHGYGATGCNIAGVLQPEDEEPIRVAHGKAPSSKKREAQVGDRYRNRGEVTSGIVGIVRVTAAGDAG